jgi:phosphohistidine phosphatase
MLTLSLLRHAKSSWADSGLDDYERPLAKRGANAAAEMGKYLKRQKLRPDLILCSGAVRTRATVELVLAELDTPAPEVRYDDALYRTLPAIMLGMLQKIDTSYRHVMMIGHNPELHELSLSLIGDGRRDDTAAALATKFPTAALAVVVFDVAGWSKIRDASGRLERFVTPPRHA